MHFYSLFFFHFKSKRNRKLKKKCIYFTLVQFFTRIFGLRDSLTFILIYLEKPILIENLLFSYTFALVQNAHINIVDFLHDTSQKPCDNYYCSSNTYFSLGQCRCLLSFKRKFQFITVALLTNDLNAQFFKY